MVFVARYLFIYMYIVLCRIFGLSGRFVVVSTPLLSGIWQMYCSVLLAKLFWHCWRNCFGNVGEIVLAMLAKLFGQCWRNCLGNVGEIDLGNVGETGWKRLLRRTLEDINECQAASDALSFQREFEERGQHG